jgi:antitoxin MazE
MVEINKWGNSQGIRIPKKYLKQLGLKVGDKVELKVEGDKLIITPIKQRRKPKIDINTLFKEPLENNKEYDWGQIGKEVW